MGGSTCVSNSKCVNTVGSYTCKCNSDYTKAGNMCISKYTPYSLIKAGRRCFKKTCVVPGFLTHYRHLPVVFDFWRPKDTCQIYPVVIMK